MVFVVIWCLFSLFEDEMRQVRASTGAYQVTHEMANTVFAPLG